LLKDVALAKTTKKPMILVSTLLSN